MCSQKFVVNCKVYNRKRLADKIGGSNCQDSQIEGAGDKFCPLEVSLSALYFIREGTDQKS
jgi:hypothetical protein